MWLIKFKDNSWAYALTLVTGACIGAASMSITLFALRLLGVILVQCQGPH